MTEQSNTTTKELQELDSQHLLHPFMSHPELRERGARIITNADGVYIYDSDGNKILDGMAGLWCTQIGYGNQEIVDAATEAMKELPYYNLFFMTSQPYAIELAKKIAEKTPGDLNEIHFASSGSEAVDSAYKLIKYYWNLKGQPQRKQFISRERAYHGSTTVAASLCGLSGMHPQFDLPLDGIHHVGPAPYYFENGGGLTPEEFTDVCVQAVEDKILEIGPNKVAAFVGEPIMGAGGMIPPPPGYWPRVEALCRKYGIIFWADEVICGWGRTGEWFGSTHFGITPDVMTMAKGLSSGYLPVSAVALGGDIARTIAEGDEEMVHGFTNSGHPVCSAVALKNIEIMERENLVGAPAKDRIDYFQEQLATLDDHPIVGETRGVGFLGAIELVQDKNTNARFELDGTDAGFICREHCFENGLVMRSVGNTMILSPPIIISRDEIDELVTKARLALDLTAKQLGVL